MLAVIIPQPGVGICNKQCSRVLVYLTTSSPSLEWSDREFRLWLAVSVDDVAVVGKEKLLRSGPVPQTPIIQVTEQVQTTA